MSLRELNLNGIYRTATGSLIRDFYLPCLSRATHYDRAVGFFSSSMLIEAAFGLSGLVKNRGRMRLVIGHPLSDEDWAAVKDGVRLTAIHSQLQADLAAMLERAGSDRSVYSFELLAWMVATGSIEIRYAFRKVGMYHEKIGVITDADGNQVVFHGSANESANALLPTRNFESLAVYPSWREDVFRDYGAPFVEGFESLWSNTTKDVYTIEVPSTFYEQLLRYREGKHQPPDLDTEALEFTEPGDAASSELPSLPQTLAGESYNLRTHQTEALLRWRANDFMGIFALATGSGKTVTALHAATRFASQGYRLALVVAVPYQILAEQWVSVMAAFNIRPIRAFYSQETWRASLQRNLTAFIAGAANFVAIVVVNDTLRSEEFQAELSRVPDDALFFVGDECHHHASTPWIDRIPVRAKFRIGMSATPWNPGRDEAKAILTRLYGPVVATYSLRNALDDGVLCPYKYYAVPVSFDDDEADEYESLSSQLAGLIAQHNNQPSPILQVRIQSLIARRARLLGALRSKVQVLQNMLELKPVHPHTLFYCGEGRHPLDADGPDDARVIDDVIKILGVSGWKKIGRITASESVNERRHILESFDDGWMDAIAAIRVLDEGFDIPTCRTAYLLASSNSYRQYVQRRGRVLRRSPGKSEATIYDLVPLPSASRLTVNKAVWRRQVSSEMVRLREFVSLASNSIAQQSEIAELTSNLGLPSIFYDESPMTDEDLYGNG